MTRRPWSKVESSTLRTMVSDKLSWATIAVMLDRSELSIWAKADRMGLQRPDLP